MIFADLLQAVSRDAGSPLTGQPLLTPSPARSAWHLPYVEQRSSVHVDVKNVECLLGWGFGP